MVKHIIPNTLLETLEALNSSSYHIMAGGTDLMIQKRNSAGTVPKFSKNVLYIANLKELDFIRFDEKTCLSHIGAATKLEDIHTHEKVPPLLKDIIGDIGGPGIRHSGTLGGNIANASPAGDGLVGLYLLDAEIKITSLNDERIIPIKKFIKGVRFVDLKDNEIITEIIIPSCPFTNYKWVKVGGRKADSISKVSFAGLYKINNGLVEDIRFAFGSVATTVARNVELENSLKNKSIPAIIDELPRILEECDKIIAPISDQRSNKEYRRKVALNIVENFIKELKEF
ncbi:MAG: xanthine dehydrogenase family protein subunit M [Erysipelotrichia bacterium]|jgi:CO/xanthine dehydrogenase FAD-binding subunit|nr:xanthine dehydrogenase family protein subunit M [Erysipelotrichia bacterium]